MNKLRQILDKFLQTGIEINYTQSEIIKVKLFNIIILMGLIGMTSFSFILFFIGLYKLLFFPLLAVFCFSMLYYLVYLKKHLFARRILFTFMLCLAFLSNTSLVGQPIFFFNFFPITAAVYFLLNRKTIHYFNIAYLVVILLILAKKTFIDHTIFEAEQYTAMIAYILVLYVLIAILEFFRKENNAFKNTITEQKDLLNEAQSLANIGSWLYDYHENKLSFTDQLYDIIGISKNTPLSVEEHLLSFIPDNHQSTLLQMTTEKGKNITLNFDFSINDGDSIQWLRMICHPYYNNEIQSNKLFGTIQDISHQREIELLEQHSKELAQLNDELKRSNQELEQFAYVASHDLQEPLRMVGNFSQLFEEDYKDKVDEEGKMYIGYIVDGVQRMSRLIDDLLQYSRVGRKELKLQTLETTKIIDAKLRDLSQPIIEKNVTVIINNLPETITAEPTLIGVVFHNLINNGIKFNKNDQPTITIDTKEKGDKWIFSIKDNGIGIAPANQEKIFEIFKRLHRKEEYKGTGIGLSLVRRILQRHGGRIWLDSELGKGTTFYFSLPK